MKKLVFGLLILICSRANAETDSTKKYYRKVFIQNLFFNPSVTGSFNQWGGTADVTAYIRLSAFRKGIEIGPRISYLGNEQLSIGGKLSFILRTNYICHWYFTETIPLYYIAFNYEYNIPSSANVIIPEAGLNMFLESNFLLNANISYRYGCDCDSPSLGNIFLSIGIKLGLMPVGPRYHKFFNKSKN